MNLQLKRMRQLKGLSQEDMALRIGIKKSRYGTWERGERMMSLEQACKVCDVLDCTLDELCGRTLPELPYADPAQKALNGYYESMNDGGRSLLVATAKSMSADPERRIVKESAESSRIEGRVGA